MTPIRFPCCVLVLIFLGAGCQRSASVETSGRVELVYWISWTGFEAEACGAVVEAFNASQDRIHVNLMTVSEMDRKLLAAIAGGMPPDVATLMSYHAQSFAAKSALMHFDAWLEEYGIHKEEFFTVLWEICTADGHVHALPQTPSPIALHWNKRLFREAGLDPERPPQTLAELDAMAEQLTKTDENGDYIQMGYLPAEPGWWNWAWGAWFGTELWDGAEKILVDCPRNVAAYQWVESYSRKYRKDKIEKFRGGFGNFDSPENPFISEKIAMEIQGVWMANFIDRYNRNLEWGAAPFPAVEPGLGKVSIAEADTIVIPKGSAHPEEAFQFIAFAVSQKGLELLNLGQKKSSPRRRMSEAFLANHPNPYIRVFIDLCDSPSVIAAPRFELYTELNDELGNAFDRIWLQQMGAVEALHQAQERLQKKWDRIVRKEKRTGRWHPEQVSSSAAGQLLLRLADAQSPWATHVAGN